jgi:hypothetical protein
MSCAPAPDGGPDELSARFDAAVEQRNTAGAGDSPAEIVADVAAALADALESAGEYPSPTATAVPPDPQRNTPRIQDATFKGFPFRADAVQTPCIHGVAPSWKSALRRRVRCEVTAALKVRRPGLRGSITGADSQASFAPRAAVGSKRAPLGAALPIATHPVLVGVLEPIGHGCLS